MNEYRVTRTELYPNNDLIARQGHYIRAKSPYEAAKKLYDFLTKSRDILPDERTFDCQLWKNTNGYVGSQNATRVKVIR